VNDLLRAHQIDPVRRLKEILARRHSAVDKSDTGTGKTYVAAAVAAGSQLPTLVVAPKVARSAWERAADHFSDKFSVVGYELLRAGNTNFGTWSGGANPREKLLKCQCCQRVVDFAPGKYVPCYCHPAGIHCIETRSRPHRYGRFVFHPAVRQVIFDEVHRCNGLDSLNSDLLIAAKRQNLYVLGLSATVAHNPLHMRALGHLLDLHNLDTDLLTPAGVHPSFPRWIRHYGCQKDPAFHGWKWLVSEETQRGVMMEIHNLIIPERGVRVRCEDIPGFPECDIQPELYDVSSPEILDRLYAEVHEAQEILKARQQTDKAPDHPLTRILRARQRIELLKTPIAEELGQDFLDKGFSVVFFVNFRQTIDELCKRFPEAKVVDGTPESVAVRDANVAEFQANQCRVLVVNNEAGGVCLSMQDLDGLHPRAGLVMPCFSAVTMRQVFGRLPRDGGKSTAHYRVLFAEKTVETQIYRALRAKLNNLDALNDADLTPANRALT
jgi:hypothetical protein